MASGTRLEHWLNGKKVLAVDTASAEWAEAKARSKFKGKAGYGEGPGRILLQDHGDEVWYRNIRIRAGRTAKGGVGGTVISDQWTRESSRDLVVYEGER